MTMKRSAGRRDHQHDHEAQRRSASAAGGVVAVARALSSSTALVPVPVPAATSLAAMPMLSTATPLLTFPQTVDKVRRMQELSCASLEQVQHQQLAIMLFHMQAQEQMNQATRLAQGPIPDVSAPLAPGDPSAALTNSVPMVD